MLKNLVIDPFCQDVIKIVIDKGLFALLILYAGFVVNKYFERYKSGQAVILEQQRILFPQALKLLDALDEFNLLLNNTQLEIDHEVSRIADLVQRVIAAHGSEIELDEHTAKRVLEQSDPFRFGDIIDVPVCGGKSFRNLLLETADDST